MDVSYDVVVVGGGPGGTAAALASARNGAKTALIERYGFLGGMATAGLVNPFMTASNGKERIIRGIFDELLRELSRRGGRLDERQVCATFDEEVLKVILDDKLTEAGVELWLHSLLTDVERVGGDVSRVTAATRSGPVIFNATVYVDGTGDGDLAARAGAIVEQGRPEDGLVQPMTLCFRMGGVDVERMPSRAEINGLYAVAREAGEVQNPRDNVLYFWNVHPGIVHFNTTRVVKRNPVDARDLTAAELEGRRQAHQTAAFMRKHVSGFEHAYLLTCATQIGVRESRRIIGNYVLTEEDVLGGRKFDDGIARGAYDVDVHSPDGAGTVIKHLKPGTSYEIPYRCLVPERVENLLIAGRCISATHVAHSSLRVMPIVTAIGEAAGTAAALCVWDQVPPAKLDAQLLREQLVKQDADLRREVQS